MGSAGPHSELCDLGQVPPPPLLSHPTSVGCLKACRGLSTPYVWASAPSLPPAVQGLSAARPACLGLRTCCCCCCLGPEGLRDAPADATVTPTSGGGCSWGDSPAQPSQAAGTSEAAATLLAFFRQRELWARRGHLVSSYHRESLRGHRCGWSSCLSGAPGRPGPALPDSSGRSRVEMVPAS